MGYVLSPEILGKLSANLDIAKDRFSAAFLVGMANRIQSEVGYAIERAEAAGKRLATLGLNSEFRFVAAEQRAEFAQALEAAVQSVVERYTSPFRDADGKAGDGRAYRLMLGCYPIAEEGSTRQDTESRIELLKIE
jgi:hypothetical protein